MLKLLMLNFVLFMIPLMMILINLFLTKLISKNRKKMSPFECGFNPLSSPRMPFSIQFFLITLMFLIFDIEIMLIVPILPLLKFKMMLSTKLMFSLVIMTLIISLWIEWMSSYLEWIN
uniref:NADH-ubiquinone oxidoreductase chain 3 n=1 Tax=Andrena chekiangensis TaxID=2572772 RepID=A0A4D6SRY6_9HYME|nr:NADH dehydrogenase subunit 3 [Andrena chekiangensis]QCG69816.1 NADH dehydrogenase subunit 3 [Andrena chekiangensis]